MGCKNSRNLAIEDAGPGSSKSSVDKGMSFSDLHIDIVRSTWPLLHKDSLSTGITIFTILFTEAPEIKSYFQFKDVDPEHMEQDKELCNHTEKVMNSINSVVDNMEDLETNDITQNLIMLGAKHAAMNNKPIQLAHLPTFTKCILLAWEKLLREEYTSDVEEAWTAVLEYMSNKLSQGYYLFLEDQAKDNLQLKVAETSAVSVTNITDVSTSAAEAETS